jgi:putative Mn2+ efflux pump MntP
MIGWVCVHYFVKYFNQFEKYVPYIAFILLLYIGGKMIGKAFAAKRLMMRIPKSSAGAI